MCVCVCVYVTTLNMCAFMGEGTNSNFQHKTQVCVFETDKEKYELCEYI